MTAPQGSNGYLVYSLQTEGAVNIRNYTSSQVLPGLIRPPANSLGTLGISGHSSDHIVHNGTWQRDTESIPMQISFQRFLPASERSMAGEWCLLPNETRLMYECMNVLPTIPLDQEVVLTQYTQMSPETKHQHPAMIKHSPTIPI